MTRSEALAKYGEYQLQWMIDQGYTLADLVQAMDEYRADLDDDRGSVAQLFRDWEDESGFHGSLWVCLPEWEGAEGAVLESDTTEESSKDEMLGQMIDVFEDFLTRKDEAQETEEPSKVYITGPDYDALKGELRELLQNWGLSL